MPAMNVNCAHKETLRRNAIKSAALVGAICVLLLFSGCDPRPNRIGVSNTLIDFGLNETPFPLYVWNGFKNFPLMRIEAETEEAWIQLSPTVVDSIWKDDESGYDVRAILVRINRTLLDKGEHKGSIKLTSFGMRTRKVEVRVQMDVDGRLTGLNIIDPVSSYSKPYLLDFTFSLRDSEGNAVTEEPARFDVAAFEDGEAVHPAETGLALRNAPPRQLLVDFVLDYSLSMQQSFGAIASLEEAARNDILRFLNLEAAAGITIFSREDRPPVVVSDFTTDQAYIRSELSQIQQNYVGSYTSGAPLFDALMVALDKFDDGFLYLGAILGEYEYLLNILQRFTEKDALQQSRHIFVITDGYDTSSKATLNDVTRRARNLFVSINVVGIGAKPNLTTLLPLAGQTHGTYFSYNDERENLPLHVQGIVSNLDGQYRLRWATLNRRDQEFSPEFQIALADKQDGHIAEKEYNPVEYAEDTLRGLIKATSRDDGLRSSIEVGMDYIPRFVYDVRLYVETTHPFEVEIASAVDGGLVEGWALDTTVIDDRSLWLHFYNSDETLPFAGYGPLFTLDFGEVVSTERPALLRLEVDNSLYADAVHFIVVEEEEEE